MNNNKITFLRILLVVLSVLLITGCPPDFEPEAGNISGADYVYNQPQNIDPPFTSSTLAAESLDQAEIINIVRDILDNRYGGIDSLLIARNNAVVLEEYFNGFSRDEKHDIRSATKSITGLLAGIAIDKNDIPSVNVAVYDYFTRYYSYDYWSNLKNDITLQHILNMSGGWECDDWDINSQGSEDRMVRSYDWAKFILDLPMANRPGEVFSYCSGGMALVGDIITAASGTEVAEFARQNLFSPLGITQFHYQTDPSGRTHVGGQMHLTPMGMLKIGQLFLNDGMWDGNQIVSSSWITETKVPRFPWYKNAWWIWTGNIPALATDVTIYYADGNGGQRIFVVPAYDLVVVFTAHEYDKPAGNNGFRILVNRIIPAIL